MTAYVPNDIHARVLKATKSSFCRRTRTLYRYMFPNISRWEMDKRVLAAWDSASETEKNVYISQVLRIYEGKHSPPMLNPRLLKELSPSILNRQPDESQRIIFTGDNTEAQPASGAALELCKRSKKKVM